MKGLETRTALITGASAGIGREFARELAKDGCNLVLTARRKERLIDLKNELERLYAIKVAIAGYDLSDSMTPKHLFEDTRSNNQQIDILVNNAGYGISQLYLEKNWEDHAAFIRVMVTAVCELTHIFLPSMLKNRYGRIINVSSVAGYLPGTWGNTLYGASKSFMIKFTESLSLELQGSGVHLSVVCPGYTYSEFHDVTQTRASVSRLPSFLWMDANDVARQSIDAVHKGQVVCINGAINQLIVLAAKVAPQKLALKLSRVHSRQKNQKDSPSLEPKKKLPI